MDLLHLKIYQSRRFYLDEYPEQKKLREEWVKKRIAKKYKVSVDYLDWIRTQPNTGNLRIIWCDNISYTLNNNETIEFKEENDSYFWNRWLKRS